MWHRLPWGGCCQQVLLHCRSRNCPPAVPTCLSHPQLMDRELLPSLRKLEQQCEEYHEYAHLSQRNEALKRQCVAFNYMETQK